MRFPQFNLLSHRPGPDVGWIIIWTKIILESIDIELNAHRGIINSSDMMPTIVRKALAGRHVNEVKLGLSEERPIVVLHKDNTSAAICSAVKQHRTFGAVGIAHRSRAHPKHD